MINSTKKALGSGLDDLLNNDDKEYHLKTELISKPKTNINTTMEENKMEKNEPEQIVESETKPAEPEVQQKVPKVVDDRANTLNTSKIRTIPIDSSQYLLTDSDVPPYIPINGENELIKEFTELGVPLLLEGEKGTGKTIFIMNHAKNNKIPIIQYDCSEGTKKTDLIGGFTFINDESFFRFGVLATAIELANECGIAIVDLEEVNGLTPQMQKLLNQLLDSRNHVYIQELNRSIKLNKDAKLLICATMNPSTYGGTNEMNEDLKSRFYKYKWHFPSKEEIKNILNFDGIDEDIKEGILNLVQESQVGVKNQELTYAISPRDIDMLLKVYRKLLASSSDEMKEKALEFAIRGAILGKYDEIDEERYIRQRINSHLGLEIKLDSDDVEVKDEEDE